MSLPLLIIVPARGGSKRLPGKNLKKLAGRSLLAHTAEAIEEAELDAPVILSTDEREIAAEGERLGWDVPGLRPDTLAADDTPTVDVILYELEKYCERSVNGPAAVMILQPTSPLRGAACLKRAVELLAANDEVDTIVSMTPTDIPPARMYLADDSGHGAPVGAGDGRRPVYIPNGALYLVRTQALRRHRTVYAGTIYPLPLEAPRAVDIDTMEDWRLAEALLVAGLPETTPKAAPVPACGGEVA